MIFIKMIVKKINSHTHAQRDISLFNFSSMEIKYFEPDLTREKRNIELNGSFGGISFKSILECNGFSTVEFSRILSKLVEKPFRTETHAIQLYVFIVGTLENFFPAGFFAIPLAPNR